MPQVSYPTLAQYLHRTVPRSIRRAQAVISPSEYTKQSIVSLYGTAPEKIRVIPEGVGACFVPHAQPADAERLSRLGLQRPFLLSPGTLEPRKNLERLLEAFASVRSKHGDLLLVLAGGRGWLDDGIFAKHGQLGLGDSVRFLGHVDDSTLSALYRHGLATVYPSLLEGFGLPPLEALACGSPLVASGNSSIPEVCGDAAVYVDPWDVEDMSTSIATVVEDEALRASLREQGPRRASTFTWNRTAQTTLQLYHDVAGR